MPSTIVTNIEVNTAQTNLKLDALNASFVKLDKNLARVHKSIGSGYSTAVKKATRNQKLFNRELKTFNTFNRNAIVNLSRAIPAYARLLNSIQFIPKALAKANSEYEKFISTMLVSTPNMKLAAQEFEFIASEADRMGVAVDTVAQPYAKMRAALASTNLSVKQSRDLFVSFSQAGTALHLTNAELKLSFLALQQIASKGKLSMEELRQQLAEKIPGIISVFEEAAGLGSDAFAKAVKAGAIDSAEILAEIPEILRKKYQAAFELAARSLDGEFKRLSNATGRLNRIITKVGVDGEESFNTKLARSVRTLTTWLNDSDDAANRLGDSISEHMGRANEALLLLTTTDYWATFTSDYKEAFRNLKISFNKLVSDLVPGFSELNFTEAMIDGIALLPLSFEHAVKTMRLMAKEFSLEVTSFFTGEQAKSASKKQLEIFNFLKKQPGQRPTFGYEKATSKELDNAVALSFEDNKRFQVLLAEQISKNKGGVVQSIADFASGRFARGETGDFNKHRPFQPPVDPSKELETTYDKQLKLDAEFLAKKLKLLDKLIDARNKAAIARQADIAKQIKIEIKGNANLEQIAKQKAKDDAARAIEREKTAQEAKFQAGIKLRKDQIKILKLINPELAKHKKALLGIDIAKHEGIATDKQIATLINNANFQASVEVRKKELKTLKLVNPELADYKQALLDIDIAKHAGHVNDQQKLDLIKEETKLYEIEIGTLNKLDALKDGLAASTKNYLQEANNSFEQFKDLGDTVFKGLEDSIVSFVKTGKFEFKDFAAVVIEELIRIQVKSAAVNLFGDGSKGSSGGAIGTLVSLVGSAASTYFGGGTTPITNGSSLPTQGAGDFFGSSAAVVAANGAIFNSGNVIPFSNGGVFSSPTTFPLRNGTGLMAEAGPEAVMPLKRGANGKLGVEVNGSQNSSRTVVINQNITVSGSGDQALLVAMQQAAKQGAEQGYAKVSRDFNRNGPLRRGI